MLCGRSYMILYLYVLMRRDRTDTDTWHGMSMSTEFIPSFLDDHHLEVSYGGHFIQLPLVPRQA